MEEDKISKLLNDVEDINDVTDVIKKKLNRGKISLAQNNSMLIYLIEGMKSTCDSMISSLGVGKSELGKSVVLSTDSNYFQKEEEVNSFEELREEISLSKKEIFTLNSKIEKFEKKSEVNEGIMKNLNTLSEMINQNLVKIKVENKMILREAFTEKNKHRISNFKKYLSKSTQTRLINKESKSTSTAEIVLQFDSTYLRPKFVLSQYPKSQHFADKLTVIAVKSVNEYLIAQDSNGFGMMEYDDVFSQSNGDYWDVIYANGSYFLYDFNNEIVMRVNPNREVDLICTHEGVDFNGRVFRVDSNDSSWLLMNKKYKSIICMNTNNKQSFEIQKTLGADCDDFQCLPGGRVLMLTEDGFLILQEYSKEEETSEVITYKQIYLLKNRNEVAITLVVCPQNKIAAISTRVKTVYSMSRLILYSIGEGSLDYKAEIDLYDRETKYFCAMSFYNYYNDNLILTGLTRQEKSILCTFLYDGENFKELVSKRIVTEAKNPRKLQLVGNEIIGADDYGKLIRISYNYLKVSQ